MAAALARGKTYTVEDFQFILNSPVPHPRVSETLTSTGSRRVCYRLKTIEILKWSFWAQTWVEGRHQAVDNKNNHEIRKLRYSRKPLS